MKLQSRTLELDIQYCSLDAAIRELHAVKNTLHGLHVNTNETGIRVNEYYDSIDLSPTLRIMLQYKSAMTDEEMAAEETSLARQTANRRLAYAILKEEFDTEKL
jgi:hypothetical protein